MPMIADGRRRTCVGAEFLAKTLNSNIVLGKYCLLRGGVPQVL
jgi:hypothetical protein